jgi:hypothetical protein
METLFPLEIIIAKIYYTITFLKRANSKQPAVKFNGQACQFGHAQARQQAERSSQQAASRQVSSDETCSCGTGDDLVLRPPHATKNESKHAHAATAAYELGRRPGRKSCENQHAPPYVVAAEGSP